MKTTMIIDKVKAPMDAPSADGADGPDLIAPTPCSYAGYLLLDEAITRGLPAIDASCLGQPEVRDALRWARSQKALGDMAVCGAGVCAPDELNPVEAASNKIHRMQVAQQFVDAATKQGELGERTVGVFGRIKAAGSYLKKIEGRLREYICERDTRHPLRPVCDSYAFTIIIADTSPTGQPPTEEDVWKLLKSIQSFAHAYEGAYAPSVALDGEPALERGGNAASAEGYSDQKLRMHLVDEDGSSIPVEIMMFTKAGYEMYKRTRSHFNRNRKNRVS